jgi:hypothetical protein
MSQLAASMQRMILIATALTSAVAWFYRWYDESRPTRLAELTFYVLIPILTWGAFALALIGLRNSRRSVRIPAIIALVPFGLIWIFSILIGFQGLRIH